jgi:hypothetical protein
MIHWNPLSDTLHEWTPIGGWNKAFSNKDKIQCTSLFVFFKEKKGYTDKMASVLAHMVIFKQKYHGLTYSEEQESILVKALKPIHLAKA